MRAHVSTLAAGLFSIGLLLYWCCLSSFSGSSPVEYSKLRGPRFIVMIDAGSSGSRVHVYSYRPAHPLPEFELPSRTLKVKPGLSSFESDPSVAGQSLRGLVEFAQAAIPASLWADTAVYLYAYAST